MGSPQQGNDTLSPAHEPEDVLHFWFRKVVDPDASIDDWNKVWFGGGAEFDRQIRDRFAGLPDIAQSGELDSWRAQPRSALALVLTLDQFPRNIHRGSARSFAYDRTAQDVAATAVDRGYDVELEPIEAVFLYMPFEHAEDIEAQRQCVMLFRRLAEQAPADQTSAFENYVSFAVRHHDIIARFGRFPHRNKVLGRAMTDEERAYLDSGGDAF